MFSCALDPAVTAGVTKALELAQSADGAERRKRVFANAEYLRQLLSPHVDIGVSQSWIIPVIYGPERRTIPLADWMQRNGQEGSVMEFPAVPIEEARMRLFVTSEHEREHLKAAADIVCRAAIKFEFQRAPKAPTE